MRISLFVVLLAMGLGGCRKSDVRTVHVYVPGMKNAACARVVVNALGREQGIAANDVKVDMAERVVTVKFDSLLRSIKNIEFAIADAGFTANEVPTTDEAVNALPPDCEVPKVPVGSRTAGRNRR